ncbi:hypothetical protein SNE40_010169 [Patella caerulea]|uniref:Uncharacterized protein n=1 Tax=Patella caerulea TaxID=87958 RepID=A0AAN8PU69_PATCE
MFKVIIACAVLSYVAAQQASHTPHPHTQHPHHTQQAHTQHPHTQHPHSTHAPIIHDNFHFFHDAADNKMIIRTQTECFVFDLSADQQKAITTPTGLRATELALVAMIGTGKQTPMKAADITHQISRDCGKLPVISIM